MEARFKLELKDCYAAQALHMRRHRWAQAIHWFAVLGFPLIGLYFWVQIENQRPEGVSPWAASGAFSALFMIAMGPLILLMTRYTYRKNFEQIFPRTSKGGECSLSANEELFIYRIEGAVEGRYLWPSLFKVEFDETSLLIYIAKKKFLMVPLGKLDMASRHDLIELMQRKAGKA